MTQQPKLPTQEQVTARRMEGGQLLQSGKLTQAEIAEKLGVSKQAVNQWKHRLEARGLDALQPGTRTGKPPRLNAQQKEALLKKLDAGARAAGFPTERWTQGRVQKIIERDFGVHYDPTYVSRLLNALGWNAQRRKKPFGTG